MRMPWGKHAGQRLEDIPIGYLVWLVNECDLKDALRNAVEKELRRRQFDQSGDPVPPNAKPTSISTEIVNTWHRRMAVKFHPDKGGSHEAMKAVNFGRDLLVQLMETT